MADKFCSLFNVIGIQVFHLQKMWHRIISPCVQSFDPMVLHTKLKFVANYNEGTTMMQKNTMKTGLAGAGVVVA
ncbi:MAG TPA: hypothetical protein VLA64_11960, partial [Azonexus sp.]|nr:hypothetical protein [Azonexus sp.]